jgi:hypothetical protein
VASIRDGNTASQPLESDPLRAVPDQKDLHVGVGHPYGRDRPDEILDAVLLEHPARDHDPRTGPGRKGR